MRSDRSIRKQHALVLFGLAVFSFWPVFRSHPLMDDHLFFSWLEQTSLRAAILQRLTGNWIPYFSQMQVYRPTAGLVQALMYHFCGTHWATYHLLNFLLHVLTSISAGLLATRLTRNREAGWIAGGLFLLHPRAGLGVALIYNFYDSLVTFLMLLSLNILWSLKKAEPSHRQLSSTLLWGIVAFALGAKEVALPLVLVLILADLLWKESKIHIRTVLNRHVPLIVILIVYLIARTYFVGHPFRTHANSSSFPLPLHSETWAFLWDAVLVLICCALAFWLPRLVKGRTSLPREYPWMVLWAGLMLFPAVHFCAQMTLRPWFFDERYWYVPLAPLCILAASLLTQGNMVSAFLAAGVLSFTLPASYGLFVGFMAFLAAGPLSTKGDQEIQTLVASCYALALAVLLFIKCDNISIRADDAAVVQQGIAKLLAEAPRSSAIVLLNFNEETVEPRASFNGDLQWLLGPPFFAEHLSHRLFFAYPTWNIPANTNRIWDRTTPALLSGVRSREFCEIYFWEPGSRQFVYCGRRSAQAVVQLPDKAELEGTTTIVENGGTRWTSFQSLEINPKQEPNIQLTAFVGNPAEVEQTTIGLQWLAMAGKRAYVVNLPLSLHGLQNQLPSTPAKLKLVFPIGNYVDWTFADRIIELRVSAPKSIRVLKMNFPSQKDSDSATNVLTHYLFPSKRFIQIGQSHITIAP